MNPQTVSWLVEECEATEYHKNILHAKNTLHKEEENRGFQKRILLAVKT